MKKILIGIVVFVVAQTPFAQSIILTTPATASTGLISPPPSTVVNDDTVTYCVADLFTTFDEGKILCINNTASFMDVKVRRFAHATDCFGSNQFCWTLCYSSGTSVSPDSIRIPANDSSLAFHGWMTPNGTEGCCFIKYRFFNDADTSVYAETTIKYCFSSNCSAPDLSIDQNNTELIGIYPNPAFDFATVNFTSLSAFGSISILDVSGKEVKQVYLPEQSTQVVVPVDDLENGIYFCRLKVNDKVISTRKLVVKR